MNRATIVTRVKHSPVADEIDTSSFADVRQKKAVDGVEAERKDQRPKNKRKSMLTSSQLTDLFIRLDKDGDGALNLEEFIDIIRILKVKVSADYAASVFKSIDQTTGNFSSKGKIGMQAFIAAYQKIFVANASGGSGEKRSLQDSFIRATRYGRMLNGEFVFECYTIPSSGKGERYTLDLSNTVVDSDSDSDDDEEEKERKSDLGQKELWDAVAEPWDGTLDDINAMIHQDSCHNKTLRTNVLWWIDAAYSSIDRTTAEQMITRFGLPNDSKFLSSFDNFGGCMPPDEKSRVYAGTGNHTLGLVYSLSYFAQALWIDNIPVVHHLPAWVRERYSSYAENTESLYSRAMRLLIDYYKTHFAWIISSSLIDTSEDEQRAAYERAEGLATLVRDGDDCSPEWCEETALSEPVRPGTGGGTIFSNKGQSVPLCIRAGSTEMPSWLQSIAQIRKRPPKVCLSSLSVHILDQGFGSHALLTVRQIDAEKQKDFSLEQRSRAGVLGRMISGVWVKLAQVIIKGERAGPTGSLVDSPATLVTILLMLVHNFSMNSVTSADHWMNILEAEIEDIVVSKHSAHLAHVERILKDFASYLDPLEGVMASLAAEQQAELNRLREQESAVQAFPQTAQFPPGRANHKRSEAHFDSSAVAALPRDAEKLSLSYSLVHPFLGADPYRELRTTLDGNELLDLKGLLFWKERMRKFALRVTDLKQLIQSQMDEKRNFATFMLTALTTLLAPMTIFTGYFGMNFDNMTELHAHRNDNFPGVATMWAISGLAYGILLVLGIHFRVIYSVS